MAHTLIVRAAGAIAALIALAFASPSAAKPVRPKLPVVKTCDRATFPLVLDVGHTAEEPGARSARGAGEFDFNLRLARRIEKKLVDDGFAKTSVLVTEGPVLRGLISRVARANRSPARLLLSIHHDSVPEFLIEQWEFEGKEQHFSDRFGGHSLFVARGNGDIAGSVAFARQLGLALKARGLAYTPHYTDPAMRYRRRPLIDRAAGVYRSDNLYVLRATRMPAVLLEAGSIVNRDEELVMASPERQDLIAAAVSEAIEQFCKARRR